MAQNSDIGILLYSTKEKKLQTSRLEQFKEYFKEVVVIAHCEESESETSDVVTYPLSESKTTVLNDAKSKITSNALLYIEADENVNFSQFDNFKIEDGFVYKAIIEMISSDVLNRQHCQLRLFPNSENFSFFGGSIPYVQPFLRKENLKIHSEPLHLRKGGAIHGNSNAKLEIEQFSNHAEAWLLQGLLYAGEQKNKEAEKCFRTAIQLKSLPYFDHAAALNGLADALYEQNKWHDCKKFALQSIEVCKEQRMPYLILFRSSFAANQWEDAYNYLFQYLEILAQGTKVNHDVVLPLDDTHFLLGEAAYKKGWHERALVHYEQYYELKQGEVGQEIVERLLIYALEIGESKNAEMYFKAIFSDKIPDKLSPSERSKLLEYLTLFVDKEWFKLPLKIYEKIFKNNTDDALILRRWVTALIKANRIEKAQDLIAKHKTTFS